MNEIQTESSTDYSKSIDKEREIKQQLQDLSYQCMLAQKRNEKIVEVHDEVIRYWCNLTENEQTPLYFILNNVFVCRKGHRSEVENEQHLTPSKLLFPNDTF